MGYKVDGPPMETWLGEHLGGLRILHVQSLTGGMICQAARIETDRGPLFVKWKSDAPPEFFAIEARCLQMLQSRNAIRVPEVRAAADRGDEPEGVHRPSFIVLEWIEQQPPMDNDTFAESFGRRLAALHARDSNATEFGLGFSNYIGDLRQINERRTVWADFYRDCRIRPQMEIARKKGRLPGERDRLISQLLDRLSDILDGLDSSPSLLHGDLWSGNYLSAGDEPVLFDPAVYWGEREVEIAYMQLFGGFPSRLYDAYDEAFPLQSGYDYRRPLHQLYPLLVHLNHFGETYGPDVDAVCRTYLS